MRGLCGKKVNVGQVSDEAYNEFATAKHLRRNIQEIFPDMSASHREMLISGTCPECWGEMFPDES